MEPVAMTPLYVIHSRSVIRNAPVSARGWSFFKTLSRPRACVKNCWLKIFKNGRRAPEKTQALLC